MHQFTVIDLSICWKEIGDGLFHLIEQSSSFDCHKSQGFVFYFRSLM